MSDRQIQITEPEHQESLKIHFTRSQQVALEGLSKFVSQGIIPTIPCAEIIFFSIQSNENPCAVDAQFSHFRQIRVVGENQPWSHVVITVVKKEEEWLCYDSIAFTPRENKGEKADVYKWENENWVFQPKASSGQD